MAHQVRKGKYSEFDKSKLLPGELALVTEGDPDGTNERALYACFGAGDVRRMVDADEVKQMISSALANLEGA